MNQPHVFNIQMVGPGIELVLEALNELPQKRVRPLYDEILGQYAKQMQDLQQTNPEPQPEAEETE
jgi:hypothetical protein